ncbi:MAG: hypothetical protein CVU87_06215 [Firmicutes bacterium HGW-Firmicutes-12]|nr:MAG: hypothetical protein CVU87_06215 [Firmicutes bacterium HGW-Firmicutes-12]
MEKSVQNKKSILTIAYNLSGALEAVKLGRFIVLVDVIDMSTTMEGLREAGALKIWGAAPVGKGQPYTNPYLIGRAAAKEATKKNTQVFVIAEPRVGKLEERAERAGGVLAGIKDEGHKVSGIWPNLGAETAKFTNWQDKLAVIVSDAGGTIYDAVWQMGGQITTVTVARTMQMKGSLAAKKGIERAINMAGDSPLTIVAASSNAIEDVLAVQYLAQLYLSNY